MKTFFWLLLPLPQLAYFHGNLVSWLAARSPLHRIVLNFIESRPSPWGWLYLSLFSGEKISAAARTQAQGFIILGLFQLLVMTGEILTLLEKFLHLVFFFLKCETRRWLISGFLFLMVLIGNLHPGLVRGFIQKLFRNFMAHERRLSDVNLQLVVTSICLTLNPSWILSIGFGLSTAANLGLAVSHSLRVKPTEKVRFNFLSSSLVMIAASPFILCFNGALSWLVLISGGLALPLFEWLLFPCCLVGVLFLPLRFFTEHLLVNIFKTVSWVSQFKSPELIITGLSERVLQKWGFAYVAFLYFFWRLFLPVYRRRRFRKNQRHLTPT